MGELTPEQIFDADPPEEWVPVDLKAGVPKEEIIEKLMQYEWEELAAIEYINRVESDLVAVKTPEGRAQVALLIQREALMGGFVFLLGVLLTVFFFWVSLFGWPILVLEVGVFGIGLTLIARAASRRRTVVAAALHESSDSTEE